MKKIIYVFLMTAWPFLNWAQIPAGKAIYKQGVEIFNLFKSGNLDALTNMIDPDLDDDSKSNIAQTILLTFQQFKTLTNGKNPTVLNVLHEELEPETRETALYIPILLSDGQVFTLKLYGLKNKENKWFITNEIHLLETEREKKISKGYKLFLAKCFACHGKFAEGTIGPNLTDAYWKYAQTDEDVFRLIKEGKKGTLMMAYKNYLTDEEIQDIVLYIAIMQNQKFKRGKSPEGTKKPLLRNIYKK